MYELLQLYGNQNQAIKRAKQLASNFDNREFATHNPCTTVYKFLEKINDFIEENKIIS